MEYLKPLIYTEVTEFAFRTNPHYKESGYIQIFICPDVKNDWLARILPNVNDDYEEEEGKFMVERIDIPKNVMYSDFMKNDDFSNYDHYCCDSLEEAHQVLHGGFGLVLASSDRYWEKKRW